MIISRLPLPPSINKCLVPVRNRLIKTNVYRQYDLKVSRYKLVNFRQIDALKSKLVEKKIYQVNLIFVFSKNRVISKKNEIKSLDVNNFIKQTLDAVVKILDQKIDDKYFKAHFVEMQYCENESDEQVIVEFKDYELKEFKK